MTYIYLVNNKKILFFLINYNNIMMQNSLIIIPNGENQIWSNQIWKKKQYKADNTQSCVYAKKFKSETYKRIPMIYPLELQIDRSIKRIFLRYARTMVE